MRTATCLRHPWLCPQSPTSFMAFSVSSLSFVLPGPRLQSESHGHLVCQALKKNPVGIVGTATAGVGKSPSSSSLVPTLAAWLRCWLHPWRGQDRGVVGRPRPKRAREKENRAPR
ncbi:hypothetical protein LY78DRAFT_691 [Colletotrichum sublineola]|nr:hypothetical protein LY78DRAFT_691 [Colletotrichum sublineola]